jgi:acetyl esterase/lipase
MKKTLARGIFFASTIFCFLIAAYPFSNAVAAYTKQSNVLYATHDGVPLYGDLYLPSTRGLHPAMMFIHGGAWQVGTKDAYGVSWGPYLADRGYVVFSIDYRLSTKTQHTWPQALLDCKAALQYLRGNAATLDVDPDRIGVGGDSAGGQLSSMLTLTQDWPAFANRYPDDRFNSVSTKVKVEVAAYGVSNMPSWWMWNKNPNFDFGFLTRTFLEDLFGGTPRDLPAAYFEASALNYVRAGATSLGEVALPNDGLKVPWFITYGLEDFDVPADGQSIPFIKALKQAGTDVTKVAVPGAGHYWFTFTSFTGRHGVPSCITQFSPALAVICKGATPNDFIAPRLLKFLANNLGETDENRSWGGHGDRGEADEDD